MAGGGDAGRVPLHRAYFPDARTKFARDHHARDVRPLARLRRDVAKARHHFAEHFAPELASLAPFEDDGLVRRTPAGLEVTNTGRLFIRTCDVFRQHPRPGGRAETFEDDLTRSFRRASSTSPILSPIFNLPDNPMRLNLASCQSQSKTRRLALPHSGSLEFSNQNHLSNL